MKLKRIRAGEYRIGTTKYSLVRWHGIWELNDLSTNTIGMGDVSGRTLKEAKEAAARYLRLRRSPVSP